jgi:hypothetical protein
LSSLPRVCSPAVAALGVVCPDCVQKFCDDLRSAGLVVEMEEEHSPIEDMRLLAGWLRAIENFADERDAWKDDPEMVEYINDIEAALYRIERWLEGPAEEAPTPTFDICAYYTCTLPDERDEQIRAIFEAHGSDREHIDTGYHFATRQRELFAMVPAGRAEACVAALTAAGFRVENIDPRPVQ